MGMYTELIFGAELKHDTPDRVIKNLKYLIEPEFEAEPNELEFNPGRNPLRGGSYSFPFDTGALIWKDDIINRYCLSVRANIKNYDGDIDAFLEWIKPYIYGGSGRNDLYAVVTYEDGDPELYFLHDSED